MIDGENCVKMIHSDSDLSISICDFFCLCTLKLCWKWRLEFFCLLMKMVSLASKIKWLTLSLAILPWSLFSSLNVKIHTPAFFGYFPSIYFSFVYFPTWILFWYQTWLILAFFIAVKFAYIKVIIYLFFLTCIFFSSSLLRYNWQCSSVWVKRYLEKCLFRSSVLFLIELF